MSKRGGKGIRVGAGGGGETGRKARGDALDPENPQRKKGRKEDLRVQKPPCTILQMSSPRRRTRGG